MLKLIERDWFDPEFDVARTSVLDPGNESGTVQAYETGRHATMNQM
jgi:hypothetical protein